MKMALKQTFGWKFRPELDYMTVAEQGHFKELVKAGVITIFKMGTCAKCPPEHGDCGRTKCDADIPENKKYCSLACKEHVEHQEEDDDAENL